MPEGMCPRSSTARMADCRSSTKSLNVDETCSSTWRGGKSVERNHFTTTWGAVLAGILRHHKQRGVRRGAKVPLEAVSRAVSHRFARSD